MRIDADGRRWEGSAIDLDGAVDPEALVAAVAGCTPNSPTVECPPPGPVFEVLGAIRPGAPVPIRRALAAAARSRGLTADARDEIDRTRAALAEYQVAAVDPRSLRERVARLESEVERRRERLADDDGEATGSRAEAAERLAERWVRCVAARQRLEGTRERAERIRDRLDRRFALEDRLENLERRARAELADAVEERFAAALEAVPGEGQPATSRRAYEGDPVTAALAVVRLAEMSGPVVLACDRFVDASAARDTLGEPVVCC